ncbi:MAG: response regulator [Candidatus Paceibacterota bacterium]|jgi:DNA-binding response OmpR family regulator
MAQSIKEEKILIIEGNVTFGEQISDALKKDGYKNILLIQDGTEGMKSIYDTLPNLILLDVTLSGQSGYDILAKKQSEPLLAKIPVFLLSTQGYPIVMKDVPQGSVAEFIMSIHANSEIVVDKVNKYFGHEKNTPESDKPSVDIAKTKLLWIEDDPLIGKILGRQFTFSNFDLFHAKTGDEAMAYLQSNKPDVIVVDLLLPGMSGFDVLQKIKGNAVLRDIPRMVLSNLSKASDMERARVLGARKFLVKSATSLDQIVMEVKGMV